MPGLLSTARALAPLLALLSGALVLPAAVAGPPPGGKRTAVPQVRPQPISTPVIAPPDGKWLVDEQGRQYFVTQVPRVEGTYMWGNEEHTRVRLRNGLTWDVASSDDKQIGVKIYRPVAEAAAPPPAKPSAEDRAKVLAGYRAEARPGKGVKLIPFADGLPTSGQWRNGFAVADMNGDGRLDLVHGPARKGGRTPVVFLGDGKGHWKRWAEARFPPLPFDYGDVAAGDLNADGRQDLVVASHLRGIVALVGDGRGGYTPWTQGIDFRLPADEHGGPAAFTSREIELVDWNADGRLDIVALAEGPTLQRQPAGPQALQAGARGLAVYLNQGDGTWTRAPAPRSRNFGSSLALADYDRDGRVDAATSSDSKGFRDLLALHTADGSWKETAPSGTRADALQRAVATADFDRDGRADLAVSYLTRELETTRTGIDVLLARDQGFERHPLVVNEGRATVNRLAAGDLDGDGNPDLVGVDSDGALWILRGDGHGGFVRDRIADPRPGQRCQGYGLAVVDLDGDGRGEIVTGFADEESSGNPAGLVQVCTSGGGLTAWKVGAGKPAAAAGTSPRSHPSPAARAGAHDGG